MGPRQTPPHAFDPQSPAMRLDRLRCDPLNCLNHTTFRIAMQPFKCPHIPLNSLMLPQIHPLTNATKHDMIHA